MLEKRVDTLERDMKDVKASLSRLEIAIAKIDGAITQMPKAMDFASLKSDVAEIKGRLSNTPTTMQLVAMVISTWTAGAAIVFAILRFGVK